jgi:hypothetical protein
MVTAVSFTIWSFDPWNISAPKKEKGIIPNPAGSRPQRLRGLGPIARSEVFLMRPTRSVDRLLPPALLCFPIPEAR